jgi:putative aldouronate transport system substrate-binding protein
MFFNFGMKGVSYNMENGYPKYTDEVMKAPQGPREILGKFTPINGAFINDVKSFEQYSVSRKQQTDAIKTWTTETEKYLMPEVYPTSAEMEEISTIMNDIKSYVDEMYFKFLFANEKTDNMDGYYAQLKKLKVDRAIQLYQNAYDRFQKR